jgi:hypothetical protein
MFALHLPSNFGPTIQRLLIHVTCFAAAECLLNMADLDTLADYYEFIQGQTEIAMISHRINPAY